MEEQMRLIEKIIDKFKRDGLASLAISLIKSPLVVFSGKKYKNMLRNPHIEERFSEIYKENLWRSKESKSGEGSEIEYTQPLREWLINTVPKLDVDTFLDAPCGDFNWMRRVLPSLKVNYIGLDIVQSVIKENQQYFSADKVRFDVANICEDLLPSCDLIMVRDCLFHLSYEDINRFLNNLSRLDYKYLLTTTHIVDDNFRNSDITSGDFRNIDLFSHPFNFDSKNIRDRVNDFPEGNKSLREMILVDKQFVPIAITVNS